MSTSKNFLPCILFIATFCGLSVSVAPVFAAGAGAPAPPPSMSNTADPGSSHHSGKSTEKKKRRQDLIRAGIPRVCEPLPSGARSRA
jgi:hypothetical protein